MSYVPQYNTYNAATGQFSTIPTVPTTTNLSTAQGIVTPAYAKSLYQQLLGRDPTAAELTAATATTASPSSVAAVIKALPAYTTTKATANDVNYLIQNSLGRPATAAEVTAYGAGTKTLADLQGYLTAPSTTAATAAAAAGPRVVATPVAVASTYQDVLGRPPTAAELASAKTAAPSVSELKASLQGGPEYSNNLTKSFVPALTYDNKGIASVRGAQPQEAQSTGLAALNTAINTQVGNKLTAPSNFNFAAPASVQPISPLVPPAASAVAKSDPVAAQLAALQMQKDLTARAEAQGLGSFVPQSANLTSPYSAGSPQFAQGGLSSINGRYNLGGYSDGGRLLRGPGDGVSDSIPARIGNRQPARLADGEFVIPARIVSELGNGSTDAGARRLYAMMDRIQKARRKTIGKRKIAVNSRADKYLPA